MTCWILVYAKIASTHLSTIYVAFEKVARLVNFEAVGLICFTYSSE